MTPSNLGFVHQFVPGNVEEPTLLLLHGTGGRETDLLDLGHLLLPGAALLSPRGKILENGMPRFFRRLAEGVFDLEDLRFRTQELADFVVLAATTYKFDANRVVAVGYSNGANIAASVLLLRPDTLRGGVLLHPMLPLTPETLPDLSGKAVFIGAGRQDPIVTTPQTTALIDLLNTTGAEVTAFWQDGGHSLTRAEAQAAQQWLQNLHAISFF